MNDIRSILRIAARRLETSVLLVYLHVAAVVVAILVLALLAVERLGAERFWPWPWLMPALAAVAIVVAGWRWHARRRSELQVAVEVDDRLDLREKLSTALHCASRTDPFARAAIEDAVETARDPKVRHRVRRGFAVTSPPRWWLSPLAILLAAVLWFVEPLNLFADDGSSVDPSMTQTLQQRNEAIEAVIKPIQENPQLKEELSDLLGELTKEGTDPDALKTRQDVQRDAIKKLTDLNKRLDEIINGPKGKTMEAVEKALEQLRTPQEGPAKELADALARGDFKAAQKALAQMMADVQKGDLDEEQRKQLAEQLADLAQQMEQLAQQQQKLEQMLQQAGLSPQLAQNPQALQEAIANNPNLNDQQKQQLMQMAMAQQAAAGMCQGLGQGMGQMAQGLMQGQFNQAGQRFAGQLNQLEAAQQFLQQAMAAAGACQGQAQGLGQGLGMRAAMRMWMQGRGGAFGNRGQGRGGKAPISPTPTGTSITQAPSQSTGGDIIARQFIDGPQVVGESRAKLRQVAGAVSQGFEEAQTEEHVPAKYREAHMHYFGELKKRVEAVEKVDQDESAAEPAADDDAE